MSAPEANGAEDPEHEALYRLTLFFEEKGIQQLFYPNLYCEGRV